jgi:hypothetical protein
MRQTTSPTSSDPGLTIETAHSRDDEPTLKMVLPEGQLAVEASDDADGASDELR